MQNNDFDNEIRDLLNSHTPEFNPADWARMQDMLANAPVKDPTGGSGAGTVVKSVTGAKVWVSAAVATLVGASALVYVTSNSDKQAPSTENQVVTTQNATTLDKTEVTTEDFTEPQTLKKSENLTSGGEETLNPESDQLAGDIASVHSTSTSTASKPTTSIAAKANFDGTSGQNVNGNDPTGYVSVNSANIGNLIGKNSSGARNIGYNQLQGNNSGSVAGPCATAKKPSLPFVVAGVDTVNRLDFVLSPCEPFCLLLPTEGDAHMFADLSDVKGAQFEISKELKNTGSFCWTPTANHSRTEPYQFKIKLQNPECPAAAKTYTISLLVGPQRLVTVIGDSVLPAGQSGRLRVAGRLPEANYQWAAAHGLVGSTQTREVLITPQKTTTYSVTVTTASGCPLTATYRVKVDDATNSSSIFVPNIFTPNGDGVDDQFKITGISPGDMELIVSNRWGKEVYRNSRYANNWDGSGLPAGIYTCTIIQHSTKKTIKRLVEITR